MQAAAIVLSIKYVSTVCRLRKRFRCRQWLT